MFIFIKYCSPENIPWHIERCIRDCLHNNIIAYKYIGTKKERLDFLAFSLPLEIILFCRLFHLACNDHSLNFACRLGGG